jgi:hypothetical protein
LITLCARGCGSSCGLGAGVPGYRAKGGPQPLSPAEMSPPSPRRAAGRPLEIVDCRGCSWPPEAPPLGNSAAGGPPAIVDCRGRSSLTFTPPLNGCPPTCPPKIVNCPGRSSPTLTLSLHRRPPGRPPEIVDCPGRQAAEGGWAEVEARVEGALDACSDASSWRTECAASARGDAEAVRIMRPTLAALSCKGTAESARCSVWGRHVQEGAFK